MRAHRGHGVGGVQGLGYVQCMLMVTVPLLLILVPPFSPITGYLGKSLESAGGSYGSDY